jgi:hypothetical protein
MLAGKGLNTNEDYDSKTISNLFLSVMSVGAAVKETPFK